jgi:hypothetical protein
MKSGPTRNGGGETGKDIGGVGGLLDERPEDLPRENAKMISRSVIPTDRHQPDEPALRGPRNRKCACKSPAVELLVALLAANLLPTLPVRQCLDEPRFQMRSTGTTTIRADCVVCWHNRLLFETIAQPVILRVLNTRYSTHPFASQFPIEIRLKFFESKKVYSTYSPSPSMHAWSLCNHS